MNKEKSIIVWREKLQPYIIEVQDKLNKEEKMRIEKGGKLWKNKILLINNWMN